MAIFDLFSKRQKRLSGEIPEIYTYKEIPYKLRVQIVQIIRDSIGVDIYPYSEASKIYELIHKALCREYGVFTLGGSSNETDEYYLYSFLLKNQEIEKIIDAIELAFKVIKEIIGGNYQYATQAGVKTRPQEAIDELNQRFKESSVGYQFEVGEIVRVDSAYIHSEIVKPTISLLWSPTFRGANEEYLKAHEHYRHGRNKECLTECLKALESTIKTICNEKNWAYNQTDTASKLIQVCFTNGLIPSFTQNQFSGLQNLLASGIPTIRNKTSGHGQGQTPKSVDDGITRYGLNLTGTNIILLIEQSGVK